MNEEQRTMAMQIAGLIRTAVEAINATYHSYNDTWGTKPCSEKWLEDASHVVAKLKAGVNCSEEALEMISKLQASFRAELQTASAVGAN